MTALFCAAGALLFVPLFLFRRFGPLDFWWAFSLTLVLLTGLGLVLDREFRTGLRKASRLKLRDEIVLGILSAGALYLVFFAGRVLISRLLPGSGEAVGSIYAFRGSASVFRVTALLLLVIGPGEELFWRALLQGRLEKRWGAAGGWLAASALYTAVHAGSGNPLLLLAAAVCGLFWGFLFLRFRSIVLNAVSHSLWDVAVFILWPLA